MKISLLTAGKDPPYVLPLASILSSQGVTVELVGGDSMRNADVVTSGQVDYYNLRGEQDAPANLPQKARRAVMYYLRLMGYALRTEAKIFHIQWFYKFFVFERTVLNLFFKALGKKLVFTAHNVNAGARDGNDSLINRMSLKILYRLVDHIFVHTEKMRDELTGGFGISTEKVTVIPFGVNNTVPNTDLSRGAARERLGIEEAEKVALFFGNIVPYKGVEHLIAALALLRDRRLTMRLVIAGRTSDCSNYWGTVQALIDEKAVGDQILEKLEFIPDEDIEVYLKASDLMVLPYNYIFQSGVLFLAFGFGLPVVATDVGSLREDVIAGENGFLCRPEDPEDLARQIEAYFDSDLHRDAEVHRQRIADETERRHSWDEVGARTRGVYGELLAHMRD